MTDREKVIKGLEDVDKYFHRMTEVCYHGDEGTFCELKEKVVDALELLKEQEPVEPRIQTSGSGVTWWNVCGNCQTAINPNDKYCHECGRPVKWE